MSVRAGFGRAALAVMMDVKGPEIRTGAVKTPYDLAVGDKFEFYTDKPSPDMRGVPVNYPGLPGDVTLSFVRKSDDILLLRDFLSGLGSRARIIAKIEDQSGVRNMHAIIKATTP